jgi:hypothetical protein
MQINKTKCDQCGRERDQQEIGGWPMIRANVGLHASSSEPHDFCDEVCLSGWLLKYHREAVNTAVKSKDLAMVYNVVKLLPGHGR